MSEESVPFLFSEATKKKLRDLPSFKKELEEGRSVQELLGFSDETMEQLCKAAYHLFEEKKYQESANAFLFLTTLNLHHCEYWLGLGMAMQFCQEYETAIDAYELAAISDVASPLPYFYLGKCLFAIHDRSAALQALDLAIEMAGEEEPFAEIKQQAELARSFLT